MTHWVRFTTFIYTFYIFIKCRNSIFKGNFEVRSSLRELIALFTSKSASLKSELLIINITDIFIISKWYESVLAKLKGQFALLRSLTRVKHFYGKCIVKIQVGKLQQTEKLKWNDI